MQTHPTPRAVIIQILKSGSFRYLWFGQIFSQLAVNMMLFTLALIIYQTTGSNAAVSGLFLSYGVPAVLFGLLAGVVVDRFDKRMVLIVCDASRAMLVLLLFFVLHNPFFVYGIVFIYAMITQFYVPAMAPTIPRLVKPDQIVSANSLFSFTYYSSLALGFILAGPMLRFAGPSITFGTIFLSFVAGVLCILRLSPQPGTHTLTMVLQKDIFRILRQMFSD
ncbi:MAG: MFS transporter, partial [Patescibacteria group bacterium]